MHTRRDGSIRCNTTPTSTDSVVIPPRYSIFSWCIISIILLVLVLVIIINIPPSMLKYPFSMYALSLTIFDHHPLSITHPIYLMTSTLSSKVPVASARLPMKELCIDLSSLPLILMLPLATLNSILGHTFKCIVAMIPTNKSFLLL